MSEYLPKAGMTAKVSEELFRSDLRARFGDAAERYLESCRVSRYDSVESHALMSPNLDMATAIRSEYWGNRYEAFLSWFVTAGLPRPGASWISAATLAFRLASSPRSIPSRKLRESISAKRASSAPKSWQSDLGSQTCGSRRPLCRNCPLTS